MDTGGVPLEQSGRTSAQIDSPSIAGNSQTGPFHFMRLPFELRLQIYHYIIPTRQAVDVYKPYFQAISDGKSKRFIPRGRRNNSNNDNSIISIFCISKTISEETLDILYGENLFKLEFVLNREWTRDLSASFTEANIQRMRRLVIIPHAARAFYHPDCRPSTPETKLWSHLLLPVLKEVRVIVKSSATLENHRWEQLIERWVPNIKMVLQSLSLHLSSQAIVKVDDNSVPETRELIKQHLNVRYQNIQCQHFGDRVFNR